MGSTTRHKWSRWICQHGVNASRPKVKLFPSDLLSSVLLTPRVSFLTSNSLTKHILYMRAGRFLSWFPMQSCRQPRLTITPLDRHGPRKLGLLSASSSAQLSGGPPVHPAQIRVPIMHCNCGILNPIWRTQETCKTLPQPLSVADIPCPAEVTGSDTWSLWSTVESGQGILEFKTFSSLI